MGVILWFGLSLSAAVLSQAFSRVRDKAFECVINSKNQTGQTGFARSPRLRYYRGQMKCGRVTFP